MLFAAHGQTERSKSERERQIPYDITYKFTNELIYKIETDSQIQRIDCGCPGGVGVGEGWSGSLELADTSQYMQDGYTTRSSGIAQGVVYGIL